MDPERNHGFLFVRYQCLCLMGCGKMGGVEPHFLENWFFETKMDNCGKKLFYMWVIILQLQRYQIWPFKWSRDLSRYPLKVRFYTPHFPEGKKMTKIGFKMEVSVHLSTSNFVGYFVLVRYRAITNFKSRSSFLAELWRHKFRKIAKKTLKTV